MAIAKDQRTGGLSETPWTYDHLSGWVEAGPNELPLARVYGSDADGRLIAAAPDLLAALARMVEENEPAREDSPRRAGYETARALVRALQP